METIKELQDKLSSLEKQKSREIIELQGIALKFEPGDGFRSLESILERVNDGYLNAWDEGIFASLLKCYGNLMNIENEITKTKSKIQYLREVKQCYSEYKIKILDPEKKEKLLAHVFERFIPEYVELNVGMDLYEDVEPEVKGIKMVELNHGLVSDSGKHEIVGKVPNSQLTSVQTNLQDRMDQNVRRRANGSDAFNGRYGQ